MQDDSNKPPKFQDVFGHTLLELARSNPRIVGVTPAMPTGCSMNIMMKEMPDRTFDVGIAEGHAMTFSAGMAKDGLQPFCNILQAECHIIPRRTRWRRRCNPPRCFRHGFLASYPERYHCFANGRTRIAPAYVYCPTARKGFLRDKIPSWQRCIDGLAMPIRGSKGGHRT